MHKSSKYAVLCKKFVLCNLQKNPLSNIYIGNIDPNW